MTSITGSGKDKRVGLRMLKMNTELDYKWVNQFLGPDESVLWKGTPLKTHLIGKKDGYMIPFSIVWFSFAVFWEANVISGAIKNGTWILSPFALFGMAFVVLGLYITIGRFIHKRILRTKTTYVVTERRFFRHINGETTILSFDSRPSMSVEYYKDGSGKIIFNSYQNTSSSKGFDWSAWLGEEEYTIGPITDVNHVYQLIQSLEQ